MTSTKTVAALLASLALPALAQQPAPGSTMPMAPGHAMAGHPMSYETDQGPRDSWTLANFTGS